MYLSHNTILIIVVLSSFYICLQGYLFLDALLQKITSGNKKPRKILFPLYWPLALLGSFIYLDMNNTARNLRSFFSLASAYWGLFLFIPFFIIADIAVFTFLLFRFDRRKKAPGNISGGTGNNSFRRNFIFWARIAALVLTLGTLGTGSLLARFPKITSYSIAIDKPLPKNKLKLVLISDLHIGDLIHKKQLARIVTMINSLDSDMVLIAGDLIDRSLQAYRSQNMGEEFRAINTTMGVYAVPGNHDYFGGNTRELGEELAAAGVKLLINEVAFPDNAVYVIGRNELSAWRWGSQRKPLKEVMEGIDTSLPLIVIDHQPQYLIEAEEAGIDLQVSGHTHRGQIWPGALITRRIYENDYGLLYKGKTAVVVTAGCGVWGPPLRIGTRAEIVYIELTSKKL